MRLCDTGDLSKLVAVFRIAERVYWRRDEMTPVFSPYQRMRPR
jgi:hypothetical protein